MSSVSGDYFPNEKPCCNSAVYHANPAGPRAYWTCDVHDRIRNLEVSVQEALKRARGLAAQNKTLKRMNHQLHVSLQREIDARIKGEGLRQRIRELEAVAQEAQRLYAGEATARVSADGQVADLKARLAEFVDLGIKCPKCGHYDRHTGFYLYRDSVRTGATYRTTMEEGG